MSTPRFLNAALLFHWIFHSPATAVAGELLDFTRNSGQQGWLTSCFSHALAPAWFRSWYLEIAFILLGVLAGWLILRVRTELILKQKRQLEKEVGLRTLEQQRLIQRLSDIVAALEASEKSLKEKTLLQEKLSLIILHDVQSPLRFLADVAARVRRDLRETAPEGTAGLLDDLHTSASSTYAFVRDFGLWLSSLEAGFVMTRQPVPIRELADELHAFFQEQLNAKGNRLQIQADPQLTVNVHRRMLQTVLRNLLDNANKNTADGEIGLLVSEAAGQVTITVTDTGTGFSAPMLDNVRQLLNTRHLDAGGKTSAIYGFRYITDFCRALGIHVSIDSTPGKGARIMLTGLEATNLPQDRLIQNN